MSEMHKMRMHVVSIFGSVCPQFPLAASDIAHAIGNNAVALSCPWQEDPSADGDYWALINDKQGVASLGRDIAVSTGWNDEPVIPVVIEQRTSHLPVTMERLVHAVREIIFHARSWGTDLTTCVHSISLGETELRHKLFLDDLKVQVGGGFGGEIDISASSGLCHTIECNLWLRQVVPMVHSLLVEAGFLPSQEKAVEMAVLSVINRIKQNGFYIPMDEAHRNSDVARKLANAILREGNWEL